MFYLVIDFALLSIVNLRQIIIPKRRKFHDEVTEGKSQIYIFIIIPFL